MVETWKESKSQIQKCCMWFTPCKAEQPQQGMKLQEKEAQKD